MPVWDIKTAAGESTDMLVRSIPLGHALAQTLGPRPVALMRGHGAVVVGPSVQMAVFRSVYTEMNAKLQAQAMALGGPVTYLDPEEARKAEQNVGGTIGRPSVILPLVARNSWRWSCIWTGRRSMPGCDRLTKTTAASCG